MQNKNNYYERLGITDDASEEAIKTAYRRAARRLHPDVNIQPGATELFLNLKEAYDVLLDPASRTAYDEAHPRPQQPPHLIRIETQYSQSALHISSEQHLIYALLDMDILAEADQDVPPPPPINIALVLDTSTSMQGARLETVKATAIELLRQLRAEDIVSIISFNDRAQIDVQADSHINIRKAEGSILALHAFGGTELYKGLDAGFQEVQRSFRANRINHIILVTDGQTYGDEDACLTLADEAAEMGIGISNLGIGSKWNDELLDALSTRTGGSCIYVNRAQDIRNLLTKKIKSLGQAYAERIAFKFQTGPNIKLQYAFRLNPELGELSTKSPMRLGSLETGSRQRILFELLIDSIPPKIEKVLLINGELKFDIPSKLSSYQVQVPLTRPTQKKPVSGFPPRTIIQALSKLTLYRMQEQAQKDLSQGNYEQATRRLKHIATHLLAQGEQKLATTVMTEAQNVESKKNISDEGRKEIKYGTRALMLHTEINEE